MGEHPVGPHEEVTRRAAAARRHAAELVARSRQLAGEIAAVEDMVAEVHDAIGQGPSEVAPLAPERARAAREFAANERLVAGGATPAAGATPAGGAPSGQVAGA